MLQSWVIGSHADCDIVVNAPQVSGRHCRLTREAEGAGFVLEDLGSTNGTFVNGVRISQHVRIAPGTSVTLGRLTPMPWPAEPPPERSAPVLLRIGRLPDNDYVVNLPMVSGHHAQVVRDEQTGTLYVEDLSSANGTAVGTPDRKIQRAALSAADTIFLGSHPVAAADILRHIMPPPTDSAESVVVVTSPPNGQENPVGRRGRVPSPAWRSTALLVQAPLLAGGVTLVGTLGERSSALFALGIAATWLGLCNAVLTSPPAADPTESDSQPARGPLLALRALTLGAFGALQCLVLWAIAAPAAGLRGAGTATVGLLILAQLAGLSLGLLVVSLWSRRAVAWAVSCGVVVLLVLLGGRLVPYPKLGFAPRMVASLLPARWAFEGLLLVESESDPASNLIERYFPARDERMGLTAAQLALAAMSLGLAAATAFTVRAAPAQPRPS